PEQASRAGVDTRSDLFSLGAVLYTASTGISPFRAESPLLTLERVRGESPTPLGQVDPTLPGWFCQVVHRLLEKDPRQRIPSATELAEALERQEAIRTVPVQEADRPILKAGEPEGPGRWDRGWRRLLAALFLAAAIAAAGAYLGRPGVSEPNRTPEIGF